MSKKKFSQLVESESTRVSAAPIEIEVVAVSLGTLANVRTCEKICYNGGNGAAELS